MLILRIAVSEEEEYYEDQIRLRRVMESDEERNGPLIQRILDRVHAERTHSRNKSSHPSQGRGAGTLGSNCLYDDMTNIPQVALLPTVDDPSIFSVKCKVRSMCIRNGVLLLIEY